MTIHYAYDGDQIIAEYDGAGTLLRKFVYGPGIDEPICLIDVANSNAVYYYHGDGLGSVVALCDVNSVPVERYAYDVFGRPTIRDVNGVQISQSAFGNPYLFTARAYDAESALYYYRARYYDYYTGRFLQPDPMGYVDGLNVYAYVDNNPLGFVDPYGLVAEPGFWEGMVPVWGSAKSAAHHFGEGHYVRGTLYTAMAVSDFFLVKSIATGIAKGAVKIAGSHTQNATTKWLLKKGLRESGEHAHHALISNKGVIGRHVPDVIKNQPWNYKMLNPVTHGRIQDRYKGLPQYGILGQWWHGTPQWSKAALGSYGGRTAMGMFDAIDNLYGGIDAPGSEKK